MRDILEESQNWEGDRILCQIARSSEHSISCFSVRLEHGNRVLDEATTELASVEPMILH